MWGSWDWSIEPLACQKKNTQNILYNLAYSNKQQYFTSSNCYVAECLNLGTNRLSMSLDHSVVIIFQVIFWCSFFLFSVREVSFSNLFHFFLGEKVFAKTCQRRSNRKDNLNRVNIWIPDLVCHESFSLMTSSEAASLNSWQVFLLRWTLVQQNIGSWLQPMVVLTCPNKCSTQNSNGSVTTEHCLVKHSGRVVSMGSLWVARV